jgi:hypothetical protein
VEEPRHIFIYGPPAAGKLTVANALAARFGLRVLDNHVTVDPALRLFSFGTPEFGALVEELRVTLIRAAALARVDIVTTLVYGASVDDDHVARLSRATTDHGGRVDYVQLRPADEVLDRRVLEQSRAGTSKVSDRRRLHAILEHDDLTTPIHDDDLRIDNNDLTPEAVVEMIGTRFSLTRRG